VVAVAVAEVDLAAIGKLAVMMMMSLIVLSPLKKLRARGRIVLNLVSSWTQCAQNVVQGYNCQKSISSRANLGFKSLKKSSMKVNI
jgi:hypothetical protein